MYWLKQVWDTKINCSIFAFQAAMNILISFVILSLSSWGPTLILPKFGHFADICMLCTSILPLELFIQCKVYNKEKLAVELLNLLVQFSRSVVSNSLQLHELQHARPPCPSPTPGVHPNSCPSSRWCHPVISSSVVHFSSCPQSLPASESFPMSQLFTWGGQSMGVSVSASVFQWTPRTDLL